MFFTLLEPMARNLFAGSHILAVKLYSKNEMFHSQFTEQNSNSNSTLLYVWSVLGLKFGLLSFPE